MKNTVKKFFVLLSAALILVCAMLLVGCKDEVGEKSITNLSYDGEKITWTRVIKADKYLVSINGGSAVDVAQTDNETIAYAYKTEENFSLSIEAVIKEGDDKNPKYTLDFVNIGTPENLRVEDGKLLWDELSEAEGYQLMKNGQIDTSVVSTNEFALSEGAFQYKVRGVKGQGTATDGNNGYYSIWSDSVSGTVLSAPKNIKYDSTTFTWDEVNGATGYVVKIGNDEYPVTDEKFAFVTNEDFTVSVKAVGNATNKKYDSSFSQPIEYLFLDTVTSLTVVNGNLDWNDVDKATGYKIKVNGLIREEVLTKSEFSELVSGQSYQIEVLPIAEGGNFFSQWSSVQTINILAQPAVTFNGNAIMWSQIYNAGGYDIVIDKDGKQVHTATVDKTTVVYNGYQFTEAGDYTVKVKANADAQLGHFESKFSNPFAVRRLAETASITVTNNVEADSQVGITFTAVPYAKSYTLKINGVAYATASDTSFAVNIAEMTSNLDASTVTFSIVANGEVTSELATLEGAAAEKQVQKLAAPTNVSISGGIISWSGVNGAEAYVVTVDGHRTKVTTLQYEPDWKAGMHRVTVQAAGNGQDVISSSFTAEKNITKLSAPTELQIDAEGYLRWTNPNTSGVAQFTVKLGDGQEFSANTNAFALNNYVNNLTPGALTQLTVCAKGNGTETIDSDFSKTGGLYKFTAPTNLSISGTNLVWDAPTYNGTAPAKYKVTVTTSNGTPQTYTVTGNSWSGAALAAGTYSFTVQAIGAKLSDGEAVSTWDSGVSMGKNFTKLASVEVTRSGKAYSWAAIPGASSYEIYIGGVLKTTTRELTYVPNFTTAGEQNVKIVAKGDTANYMDADALEFRQVISAVTTPTITVTRSGNTVTVTVTNLTVTDKVEKIVVNIGGVDQPAILSGNSGTYQVMGAAGTVSVKVKAVASGFGTDGVYYIDSAYSDVQNV